ncbi:MAG: 4'-phosphopantetheinyl transferase superfamily protein [Oscillospiraceae bacterium]|nr:4'-phosphopantetheinyl transferase superfamily protein [Oscillospiraceae bacterium]
MNVYFTASEIPGDKSKQREAVLGLLDYALMRDFGVKRSDFGEFVYGEHGKPYFAKQEPINPGICFSYSHCKYGIACAVARREIGVDIQNIQQTRKTRPALIERVCCADEISLIKTEADFTRIWVLKEAFAKFTGKGFSQGFKGIDTTVFPPELVHRHGNLFVACYAEPPNSIQPLSFTILSDNF